MENMNKKMSFITLLSLFFISGCAQSNSSLDSLDSSKEEIISSEDYSSDESEDTSEGTPIITSIQDMNILHAWNWRMNDIKSRLSKIKNAGYGAIQISPMQPKVDKNNYTNQNTWSQWWKLYQPLEFKVATEDENFLGTKEDLTSLCNEAKKYDLKIIADVVSNHLAGSGSGYDSQVYTKYPLHNYGSKANDNNGESVVKGHIDLPDLDTSTTTVQNAVLELMKEYIDCGISGFRFDAAKHIETPDDGSYSSNFWPTIINGTSDYAISKGLDEPYYYGEVLNTPGAGRSFESYTKLMSICDNRQGTEVVKSIKNNSTNNLLNDYKTGAKADHLVLWSESHDTYANTGNYEITREFSTETINKAYMIQASRKDAATLYFARPQSMGDTICSINDNSGWKNKEIIAINKFHSLYVGQDESLSRSEGKYFVNVRGKGTKAGATIINVNGSSNASIKVPGLANGNYIDLISNTIYQVDNEEVDVKFLNNGACILVPSKNAPSVTSEEPTIQYSLDVILQNYDDSKYYYAWLFDGAKEDKWVKLTPDGDALGFNINGYKKFVIVEKTSDTMSWDNKIWQSIDYSFASLVEKDKVILDCSTISKI